MASRATVAIAEDDPAIRDLLIHHLEREGFAPLAISDGLAALRAARNAADLLILDIGLPGLDGFEVLRTLRREGRTIPIVVVTARAEEIDRVIGLEMGADDYVCKPFSPRELAARIKALLRRSHRGSAKALEERPVRRFGRLEIDEAAREARVDSGTVALKPREFDLLLELTTHEGIALTRERIIERVWGADFDGDERTIDVHVRRLRAKLEEGAGLPPSLQTVHGYGYRFRSPPAET
ncbi:MAG: response regulator transcription factor [Vulcanimicrobiaceae bacterium]